MSDTLFDRFIASQAQPKAAPAPAAEGGDLFDAFIAAHGATPQDAAPQPQASHPVAGPSGDVLKDAGRIAGTTGANVAAGLLGTPNLIAQGVDWVGGQLGMNPGAQAALESIPTPGQPGTPLFPSPERAKEMAFNTTGGTEFQPESWLGRRGMDALSGMALGPLAGARAIPSMIGGAVTGGAAAEEFPAHPLAAAILGSVPGAWAGRKIGNAPLPAAGGPLNLRDAQLAQMAVDQGIPLAPGQLTNSRLLANLYSEGGRLPFSGAEAFREKQQTALNRNVLGAIGEDAWKHSPEVLLQARDRIGQVFDNAAARTGIRFDQQLGQDFQNIVARAPQVLTPQEMAPIANQLRNVLGKVQPGGIIDGETYQALTRKGTPLDAAMNSANPNIAGFARDIRSALDDALERSSPPEQIAALRQARAQWKALRTIEPLTVRADTNGGALPSTGDFSPAALRGAVNQSYQRAPLAQAGEIPLNDLAKIAQRFLKEPPDSGTAGRTLAQKVMAYGAGLGATGAGALAGSSVGLSPLAAGAATIAAPLTANRLAQMMLRAQPISRQQIRASLNPSGFQFTAPDPLLRLMGAASVPAQQSTRPTP